MPSRRNLAALREKLRRIRTICEFAEAFLGSMFPAAGRGYPPGGRSPSPAAPLGLCACCAAGPLEPKKAKKKALPTGEPTNRMSLNQKQTQGNDDSSEESESRETMCSDEGTFSQEYLSERPNL